MSYKEAVSLMEEIRAQHRGLVEQMEGIKELMASLRIFPKPERAKPISSIAKTKKTNSGNKRGGFRSDTPKDLTGLDRRTWLSEEINYVQDANKHLTTSFNENADGQMDKHRTTTALFLAEKYLNRYICNLTEQLQKEELSQTEQVLERSKKIIPFPIRNPR